MFSSSSTSASKPRLVRLNAADCTPRPVRWLWADRLPLGKVTLLIGDPGLGKSFFTLDLAARLSQGQPLPASPDAPTRPVYDQAACHAAEDQLRDEQPDAYADLQHRLEHFEDRAAFQAASQQLDAALIQTWQCQHADALADADRYERRVPFHAQPAATFFLACEDDPHDTVAPRLLAAGAEMSRVELLGQVHDDESPLPRQFSLKNPHDLNLLEQLLTDWNHTRNAPAKLLVIDPIAAFFGDEEAHTNTRTRNVLDPLSKLAERLDLAILAITHLNKNGNAHAAGDAGNALYRAMGSIAFTAHARTVHLAVKDPDPDHPHRRWLIPLKNNLAPLESAVRYDLTPNPTNPEQPPTLTWHDEPFDLRSDEVKRVLGTDRRSDQPGKLGEAQDWLRTELAAGPKLAADLIRDAAAGGFPEITLRRAAAKLLVHNFREKKHRGRSLWCLAGTPNAPEHPLGPHAHLFIPDDEQE